MVNREPDRGDATATPLNVSYRIGRISKYLSGHWLDFGCADGGYEAEMLARGLDAVSGVDVEEGRHPARSSAAKRFRTPISRCSTGSPLPGSRTAVSTGSIHERGLRPHALDEDRRRFPKVRRELRPGRVPGCPISPNRWFPIEGHNVTIGSMTICPAPLIPWLPERLTHTWTAARNYWPRQLERRVCDAGFAIKETSFIWPVLET